MQAVCAVLRGAMRTPLALFETGAGIAGLATSRRALLKPPTLAPHQSLQMGFLALVPYFGQLVRVSVNFGAASLQNLSALATNSSWHRVLWLHLGVWQIVASATNGSPTFWGKTWQHYSPPLVWQLSRVGHMPNHPVAQVSVALGESQALARLHLLRAAILHAGHVSLGASSGHVLLEMLRKNWTKTTKMKRRKKMMRICRMQ